MDIITKNIITINRGSTDTNLLIGRNLISNIKDIKVIPQKTAGFVIIADDKVANTYGRKLWESLEKENKPVYLIKVKATEKNKSLILVQEIFSLLLKKGVNKKFLLINIGGGIISDIGGFVAGIFNRGIAYINIPTTLLSQVDAAIGGKTGVNFQEDHLLLKNMVGTVHMPIAVISDIDTLKTLPKKEIRSGLGEMLKYSLISEKIKIKELMKIKNEFNNTEYLSRLVSECQNIKMSIVSKDLYDIFGIREILNLGHTIGHGIESASEGKMSHGQCVALGIVAIIKISMEKGLLSLKLGNEIITNIEHLDLPVKIPNLNSQSIIKSMKLDKKCGKFVLIRRIGEILTNQNVEQSLVEKTLKEMTI